MNSLTARPRFSWDAKSPPWTDDKRNQEKYRNSVVDWKDYHDSLPENSLNKVFPFLQGILLKSQ